MEVNIHPDHHWLIHNTHLWVIITIAVVSSGLIAITLAAFPNTSVSKYGLNTSIVVKNQKPVAPTFSEYSRRFQPQLNSALDVYGFSTKQASQLGKHSLSPSPEPSKFSSRLKTN